MNRNDTAKNFSEAIGNACGELNEAARLAQELFSGDDLKNLQREIARLMEQVETRLIPVLRKEYPDVPVR